MGNLNATTFVLLTTDGVRSWSFDVVSAAVGRWYKHLALSDCRSHGMIGINMITTNINNFRNQPLL